MLWVRAKEQHMVQTVKKEQVRNYSVGCFVFGTVGKKGSRRSWPLSNEMTGNGLWFIRVFKPKEIATGMAQKCEIWNKFCKTASYPGWLEPEYARTGGNWGWRWLDWTVWASCFGRKCSGPRKVEMATSAWGLPIRGERGGVRRAGVVSRPVRDENTSAGRRGQVIYFLLLNNWAEA